MKMKMMNISKIAHFFYYVLFNKKSEFQKKNGISNNNKMSQNVQNIIKFMK